jgi:hypothetical protein
MSSIDSLDLATRGVIFTTAMFGKTVLRLGDDAAGCSTVADQPRNVNRRLRSGGRVLLGSGTRGSPDWLRVRLEVVRGLGLVNGLTMTGRGRGARYSMRLTCGYAWVVGICEMSLGDCKVRWGDIMNERRCWGNVVSEEVGGT